jgi:hypothetical protein
VEPARQFLKRRGYDLIPHLPELLAGGTPQADAVRHDWGRTLSDLIRENYLAPLTSFAEAHHTRFRSQTYGQPAVTLADEAVPNLPEGEGPQWRAFSYTRWASSASHLYGRNITSAETWTWLHSPAFRATPLDMKAEADRMFLLGVNQFVGHGYPYSPAGAGEPGWSLYAAAVFNSHNPWFPVMPEVTKYLQRVSWLLRQGTPANDIAILLPEDDAQAAFTPGHDSVTDEMRKRITPALMAAILDAGYNVDYIDAATIDKLGAIPYPVLVIPPTTRIPLQTYKKIESFAASSGKVIAIERLPALAPGLMEQNDSAEIASVSDRLFKADNRRGMSIDSIAELANVLHSAFPPDVQTAGKTEGLGFLHRKLSGLDVYFVANTSNRPIDGTIQFRSKREFIDEWDPDSGNLIGAAQNTRIPLLLAPYESRIFVLHDTNEGKSDTWSELLPTGPHVVDEQLADLSSGWMIRFGQSGEPEALPALTSWTNLPGKQFYSGEVIYSRSFKVDANQNSSQNSTLFVDFGAGTPFEDKRRPNASGMLALLDPPIREAATVFINGKRAGSLWHPPYRIAVSQFIHPGENQVEIHVYNTAINLLAGQPPRDYTALRAKYGHRFDPQDMDRLQPIPSGLFGPIQLEAQRRK